MILKSTNEAYKLAEVGTQEDVYQMLISLKGLEEAYVSSEVLERQLELAFPIQFAREALTKLGIPYSTVRDRTVIQFESSKGYFCPACGLKFGENDLIYHPEHDVHTFEGVMGYSCTFCGERS